MIHYNSCNLEDAASRIRLPNSKRMPKLKLFIITAIAICTLGACKTDEHTDPPTHPTGLIEDELIIVNSSHRAYHLYIPTNYINAPIVILFHGHSGNYDMLLGLDGVTAPYKEWLSIAERENVILLIPNGEFINNLNKGWNDCRSDAATNSKSDDVLFISSAIDEIITKYEANPKRVYLNGTSNGGHMCIRLANELPEKITAFATIVAANAVNSKCSNSTVPVSALFMNGTADPILPYDGGQMSSNRGEVFSTASTIDYWVNRNGTESTADLFEFPDSMPEDSTTVERHLYKNGTNNTEVALYKVIRGGHNEPSKTERLSDLIMGLLGNQNGDIEMAEEVWNFFKDKSK